MTVPKSLHFRLLFTASDRKSSNLLMDGAEIMVQDLESWGIRQEI